MSTGEPLFLNTGRTLADFRVWGKVPDSKERLIWNDIGFDITLLSNFKILIGILSEPDDLVKDKESITLMTSRCWRDGAPDGVSDRCEEVIKVIGYCLGQWLKIDQDELNLEKSYWENLRYDKIGYQDINKCCYLGINIWFQEINIKVHKKYDLLFAKLTLCKNGVKKSQLKVSIDISG